MLKPPRRPFLLRWHKWAGLVSSIIVLVVAATGILINHGPELRLRETYVASPVILLRYGLTPNDAPNGFPVSETWVSWVEGQVFLGGSLVADQAGEGVGAVASQGIIIAAARDQLFLMSTSGQLIERMQGHALPAPISAIGTDESGAVLLQTSSGIFAADSDFLTWTPVDADSDWSQSGEVPADIREALLLAYRGEGISLDRILLDLHTGRIFGAWGVYIFDAAAIVLLFLAVSGVVNVLRPPRRRLRNLDQDS